MGKFRQISTKLRPLIDVRNFVLALYLWHFWTDFLDILLLYIYNHVLTCVLLLSGPYVRLVYLLNMLSSLNKDIYYYYSYNYYYKIDFTAPTSSSFYEMVQNIKLVVRFA